MTKIDSNGNHYQVYQTFYQPQFGYNHLLIRNVEQSKNYRYNFHIGVFLKSQKYETTPRAEMISCFFQK